VPAGGPAIRTRFYRFPAPVQQGPVQRQETQIVQPCKQLDDFLPGFGPVAMRLLHTSGTAQRIRTPTRFEPPPAGPNSMS